MSIEDNQSETYELFDAAKHELPEAVQTDVLAAFKEWSEAYEDDADTDELEYILEEVVDMILSNVADKKVYDKNIPWFAK